MAKEYLVVEGNSIDDLVDKVNAHLAEEDNDYDFVGGIVFKILNFPLEVRPIIYCQAMVRDDK